MGLTERVVAHFRGSEWLPPSGDAQERDLAMVELMVLAAHADRHDTESEDHLIHEFCASRGWAPPLDAATAYERAVATVAEATTHPDGVAGLVESICVRLGDAGAQQFALTEVAETMLADGELDLGEMDFVDRLRERFGITPSD